MVSSHSRFPLSLALALSVAIGSGCGNEYESLVVVEVSARPPISAVTRIHGVVSSPGRMGPIDYALGGLTSIPPSLLIPIHLPAGTPGPLRIELQASTSGGEIVATGTTIADIVDGRRTNAAITLIPGGGLTDGGADLGVPDLASPVDMNRLDGGPPDSSEPPDQTAVPDLTSPPVVPSNVSPGRIIANAGDLSSKVTAIDTTGLRLLDVNNAVVPLPANAQFVVEGGLAVLSVGKWTVNATVSVTGQRPLVVVASGPVDIAQSAVNGSAYSGNGAAQAGPGGGLPGAGDLHGGDGAASAVNSAAGGGGGGGATSGGNGGNSVAGALGGVGGASFAMGNPRALKGGSGGGAGGNALTCSSMWAGRGGAGGGAIQIFSSVQITMSVNGGVVVNGGGGYGGCGDQGASPPTAGGGGGGGGGGTILLEAPYISVSGELFAHGGGGGSGADANSYSPGHSGANPAWFDNVGAAGGAAVGTSGPGGSGGFRLAGPTPGGMGGASGRNGGGGGGAVGRITLRTRTVLADTKTARISPDPLFQNDL